MKSLISQYAKVTWCIVILLTFGFLTFLLSSDSNGFQSKIPNPTVTVKNDNAHILSGAIASRKPPEITVNEQILNSGQRYDFLSFATALNADGTTDNITLKINSIIDPEGNKIIDSELVAKSGLYKVEYCAEENYHQSIKKSTKTINLLAR